jgi:hypothetical protein
LVDASGIAIGWTHACATRRSAGPVCWGRNDYGQLGDDSMEQRAVPVEVLGL